jgi:glycosyltransferase involved in cell wall biosynthesis
MNLPEYTPLVSIGIPVYNGEKTIEKTLKRITNQDYKNIEVIVSDNCSTDFTVSIAEKIAREDSRVKVYKSNENRGLIWNFNRVFSLAEGEYFMWASHDDEHSIEFVSSCIEIMRGNPNIALCAPNVVATWEKDESEIWMSSLESFSDKGNLELRYSETLRNFPAVAIYGVYQSSLVKKTKLMPHAMGGDLLFIQNLSLYGKFVGLNQHLFTYRQRFKWNSVSEDFQVFFAGKNKPKFYSPFIVFSYWQYKILFGSDITTRLKSKLFLELVKYQSAQLFLKLLLKIIRIALPSEIGSRLAKSIYWKWIHNDNVQVLDANKYEERVIEPVLQISR